MGLVTLTALIVLTLLCAARMAASTSLTLNVRRAVVVSGAVLSIYGILQYFGLDPFINPQSYRAGDGPFQIVRPPGTFGHADYFSTWLVFVVFAAAAILRIDTQTRMRIVAVATMLATSFAIVLTGTRAALVGLAAGAVVLIAYRAISLKTLAIALTAGTVALGVFILSPAGTRLLARIHWSAEDIQGGARLLLWRDSLNMAMRHPLIGWGSETFSLRFPQYESAALARAYPDFYHESPHNVLLDELTAAGVPGLVLFMAPVILALWPMPRQHTDKRLVTCLSATVVALFVCQQFSVFVAGGAFAFYLAIAMLIDARTPIPNLREMSVPSPIGFRLPAIALSACFTIFAAQLTVGDYQLARADSSVKQREIEAATQHFARAVEWLPGPAEDLYFSRTMASLALQSPDLPTQAAAWQQAISYGLRAVRTAEDRQNAWYSLASLLARQNDTVGVERSLRSAIAWAPNWFKPHWKLAEVLALSGQSAEALVEVRKAVDLDGGRDPEVSATYHNFNAP